MTPANAANASLQPFHPHVNQWLLHAGEGGVFYMPPLAPGDKLWPELVSEAEQQKALAAAEAAMREAAGASGTGDTEVGSLMPGSASPDPSQEQATAAESEGAVGEEGPKLPDPKTVFVVYGAHAPMLNAQAAQVGQRYQLPVTSFDDLLFEAADMQPPPLAEGEVLPPPQPTTPPPATPPGGKAKPAGGKADTPPPQVPEVFDPNTPPVFDRTISDTLYAKVFTDPDLESSPGFVPPHTKLPAIELENIVAKAIRNALFFSPTFARGLVLGGLHSRYLAPQVILRLVLTALSMTPVQPPEPEADPKAKAKPKGKGTETPPPPRVPEAWVGRHKVFVSSLAVSKDLALQIAQQEQEQREREEAEAQAEAQAQAEAAAAAAEAERVAASSPQPPESSRPATTQPEQQAQVAASEAPEPEHSPEELAAKAEAEAAAAEAARQAREAAIIARADGLVDVFTQQHSLVTDVVGKPVGTVLPDGRTVERTDVVFVNTTAEPGVPDEKLLLGVCGISFLLGDRKSSFPSVETDDHLIPEPFCMQVSEPACHCQRAVVPILMQPSATPHQADQHAQQWDAAVNNSWHCIMRDTLLPLCMQIVSKPRPRPPRQPVARFKLYSVEEPPPEAPPEEAAAKTTPRTPPKVR
jgi:hypothetical protein